MKHFLLASSLLLGSVAFAQQTITPEEYQQKKAAGQLDPHANYLIVTDHKEVQSSAPARYSGPVQTQSTVCNCIIPLDTTFSVVPFNYSTGSPDYRNDDGSSPAIQLPFSFNFFGTSYDSLYINNNGNISFGSPYPTFTASPFPDPTYSMIAPFWGDVDTRNPSSGLVYYKITPTHLIIKWDTVGYYSNHTDKLNTFQLIITDGTDTILPPGSNVSFCYGDMQWTTGDASYGINGFGGVPSTTGVNKGNGVDYFQVTRDSMPGNTFDGPYGSADGVDWLDGQEVYFNTALPGNVPPLVMNSSICDTIDVYTGDTLRAVNMDSVMFDFYFMTPEPNQVITSATISTNAPASALSYTQNSNTGVYQSYTCTFRAKNLPPGIYTVTGTATDNGSPSEQGSGQVVIHTYYDPTASIPPVTNNAISLYPNPFSNELSIQHLPAGTVSVTLTDVLGNVVCTPTFSGDHATIDGSNLAPGIYFVNVVNANGERSVTKVIRN